MQTDANQLRKIIAEITPWQSGNRRAPHRPLLLLQVISNVQRRLPRLTLYADLEPTLRTALRTFGPVRKSDHPEYPFWHLQSSGIWEVQADKPIKLRKGSVNPSTKGLVTNSARGGLIAEWHELLGGSPNLQAELIHDILDKHFPEGIHDDIISFFGLQVHGKPNQGGLAPSAFHTQVLEAYSGRCSVTGFAVRLDGPTLGVESSHILWPQAGGRNEVSNGLALTTLHRKLFQLGVFTVDLSYRVRVSPVAKGPEAFISALKRFEGKKISLPTDAKLRPSHKSLEWHRKEVWRSGSSDGLVEALI